MASSSPPSDADRLAGARRLLELTAAVVHDLNQSLLVIAGQLEMIREGIVGPDSLPRQVEAMDGAAQRAVRLTRGLRAELGRGEVLGASDVAEVVRLVAPELDLHLADGLRVAVREDRLALLVRELARNALTHGAPPVWVDLRADGARARLEVVDHGPGVPEAERLDLLKPFRGAGEGVGLAIVSRIARGASGHVELAETPGGGLTARVWLPLDG